MGFCVKEQGSAEYADVKRSRNGGIRLWGGTGQTEKVSLERGAAGTFSRA